MEIRHGWPAGNTALIAIVESARAILNLDQIVVQPARKPSPGSRRPGSRHGGGAQPGRLAGVFRRSALVLHTAAYDLQAIGMVYTDFKDISGLESEARQAAGMGFSGKQVIHPGQVEAVQRALPPRRRQLKTPGGWCKRTNSSLPRARASSPWMERWSKRRWYRQRAGCCPGVKRGRHGNRIYIGFSNSTYVRFGSPSTSSGQAPTTSVMANNPINLAVRFFLEAAGLFALAYWGWSQHSGAAQRLWAIGVPLIAAACGALFVCPVIRAKPRSVLGLVCLAGVAYSVAQRWHLCIRVATLSSIFAIIY